MASLQDDSLCRNIYRMYDLISRKLFTRQPAERIILTHFVRSNMRTVLCIHPTQEKVGVVVDNDITLKAAINALSPDDWSKFEGEFNFDGCEVARGDASYFPVPKRMKMTAEEYIQLVLNS